MIAIDPSLDTFEDQRRLKVYNPNHYLQDPPLELLHLLQLNVIFLQHVLRYNLVECYIHLRHLPLDQLIQQIICLLIPAAKILYDTLDILLCNAGIVWTYDLADEKDQNRKLLNNLIVHMIGLLLREIEAYDSEEFHKCQWPALQEEFHVLGQQGI